MKVMSWENAFNAYSGTTLNIFLKENYPEIPAEAKESIRRWYIAGCTWISLCSLFIGIAVGGAMR